MRRRGGSPPLFICFFPAGVCGTCQTCGRVDPHFAPEENGYYMLASAPQLRWFGNLIAQGVKERVIRDGFWGIFTGGLCAAAGGIAAAVIFGWLASLVFKQKDK